MATSINQWKLSFQVSPIFLTGPPLANLPQTTIPILAYIHPGLFPMAGDPAQNITTPAGLPAIADLATDNLDLAFGAFSVLPGGTIIQQETAKYPFYNQWTAANAVIRNPLTISLIWDTPMKAAVGTSAWAVKMAVMTNLKLVLENHNNLGGTYTVVTPSVVYDNLVMTGLTDNSRGVSPMPQNAWRFDFERPLIQLAELQAAAAMSPLMNALNYGLETQGNWSGFTVTDAVAPLYNLGASAAVPSITAIGQMTGGVYGASPL